MAIVVLAAGSGMAAGGAASSAAGGAASAAGGEASAAGGAASAAGGGAAAASSSGGAGTNLWYVLENRKCMCTRGENLRSRIERDLACRSANNVGPVDTLLGSLGVLHKVDNLLRAHTIGRVSKPSEQFNGVRETYGFMTMTCPSWQCGPVAQKMNIGSSLMIGMLKVPTSVWPSWKGICPLCIPPATAVQGASRVLWVAVWLPFEN